MDTNIEKFGYKQELKRELSTFDLVTFGLIYLGPLGSLVMYGIITTNSQGQPILSCLTAFIAVIFTCYSYSQMVKVYPMAGAAYTYTSRTMGSKAGFIFGWALILDYFFVPMLILTITSMYASRQFGIMPFWGYLAVYLILISAINILGSKVMSKTNAIFIALMYLVVFLFLFLGIRYLIVNQIQVDLLKPIIDFDNFNLMAVSAGAIIMIVQYLGFDAITVMAEDSTEKTVKNIGKALFICATFYTVILLLIFYVGELIMPDYTLFEAPNTAMIELGNLIGGTTYTTIAVTLKVITVIAAGVVAQASASRLLYGMGRDGVLARSLFGKINVRFKTPVRTIIFMSVITFMGGLFISVGTLSEVVSFGALIAFLGVNASVIIHFHIINKKGKWHHIVFPLLGIIVTGYVLVGMSPVAKIMGLSWIAIGIAYMLIRSAVQPSFKEILKKDIFSET